MALIKKTFYTKSDLIEHIKSHVPSFYYSSQTSTVIPYDHLEEVFQEKDFCLVDLSQLPKKMELREKNHLYIEGPVSWKDAKEFLQTQGKAIKTSPTEELALITAGAATSATGERYFSFGNLRSQISSINYLDYQGQEQQLSREKSFNVGAAYTQEAKTYAGFKNPPYPVFENETDLMIGTEGQLGVITSLVLEVADDLPVQHLFMLLPKWEEDYSAHLEVAQKVQDFRKHSYICEFIDSNSFEFLKKEDRLNQKQDVIFFEVRAHLFEEFYENFIMDLQTVASEQIFELSSNKFHHIRASIPRAVFEENSRQKMKKMGTDVQVKLDDFKALFDIYRRFASEGIRYNLFGHFGDAHLHFNFMATQDDVIKCQDMFIQMYKEVKQLKGSPFAEHGIGIIKQKFIKEYWSPHQKEVFETLKKTHDPYNQFFPQGFMCIN